MSHSQVTQCPHCQTRFRVNDAQLAAAQGNVRCGACLHVFLAKEHLQGAQAAPKAELTPSAPATEVPTSTAPSSQVADSPANKTPLDTLWIHDDLDLDNLDLDEELAKLEREESARQKAVEPLIAVHTPNQADESWAEALLLDDKPLSALAAQPNPNTEAALIATDEAPLAQAISPPLSAELAQPLSRQAAQDPVLNSPLQLEVEEEPLDLSWQQPAPRPWGRWLFWGLLNLLAALALGYQYLMHNFDTLARQEALRPWLEQLCPVLQCTLPSRVDVQQIRSSNLVVRNHPRFPGALIMDALIYNRASFAQPFPLLDVRFSDMHGQLIATRRFKPSEYLAGELAGQSQMPPQTPIRIALEILDPGAKASSYSLSFQSP